MAVIIPMHKMHTDTNFIALLPFIVLQKWDRYLMQTVTEVTTTKFLCYWNVA